MLKLSVHGGIKQNGKLWKGLQKVQVEHKHERPNKNKNKKEHQAPNARVSEQHLESSPLKGHGDMVFIENHTHEFVSIIKAIPFGYP